MNVSQDVCITSIIIYPYGALNHYASFTGAGAVQAAAWGTALLTTRRPAWRSGWLLPRRMHRCVAGEVLINKLCVLYVADALLIHVST